MSSSVLVTGGAGYIGSHTVIELLNDNQSVVVIDNLINASYEAIRRIERITGKKVTFYKVNLLDKKALLQVFQRHTIGSVIHFGGLKAVGELTRIPLDYYDINITGTITLLQVMQTMNVKQLVFSSSATVYGDPPIIPIPESSPMASTNPYGRTKQFVESIIQDMCNVNNSQWRAALLRYFNPAGAHPSGLLGENPVGVPNNLMPYLSQVAIGKRASLSIYGKDYPTKDGTAIRDYIHVVDLAKGHLAALKKLGDGGSGCVAYNLGTGHGSTVLEMVQAFSKAVGRPLAYDIVDRRPGDVANLTADPTKAKTELNWEATIQLDETCASLWHWQSNNPNGLEDCPGDAPPESILCYL
ncbi:unnamed protein product [Absidia cylindrospora]